MKKFRVLSDLHLDPDINGLYPLEIKDKEIFTVLCGDTAGEPDIGHEWISRNVKRGIVVNGNHMPYNFSGKTMQEQREDLARKYPIDSDISYLDVEIGNFKKEVDGILFIGTCMYSNMKVSDPHNPSGDVNINKMTAKRKMNDYRFGIKEKKWPLGSDNSPSFVYITPSDYEEWFNNAYNAIEQALNENEALETPKPVVLITHFPLIKKMMEESYYDSVRNNYASYGNDMETWIAKHSSIRCYCCGHTHDVKPDTRCFKIFHADGTHCLVVNNARGYVDYGHHFNFNPDTFVNTSNWELEQEKESEETKEVKKRHLAKMIALESFGF